MSSSPEWATWLIQAYAIQQHQQQQLPGLSGIHSDQLVYPKASKAASSENHWFFSSSF